MNTPGLALPRGHLFINKLHRALNKKDKNALAAQDVAIYIYLTAEDVSYQDSAAGENIFHKYAKMPFSQLMQRHTRYFFSMNCDAILQEDCNGATALLTAICHNNVWFLETIMCECLNLDNVLANKPTREFKLKLFDTDLSGARQHWILPMLVSRGHEKFWEVLRYTGAFLSS